MKKVLLSLLVAFGLSACVQTSPIMNYTDLSSLDFSNMSELTHEDDCSFYLFGIIGPFGDAKLAGAIEKGNIKKVYLVDKSESHYVLWRQECVHVYGEPIE